MENRTNSQQGRPITIAGGKLQVPSDPIIPFIEGDGSGPDIWRAAQFVFDSAVEKAYHGDRKIVWKEVFAGQKSADLNYGWLPEETIAAFRQYLVGIKGPLTTPVGGGMRSLNVALRKALDLYVCLRPVRWFKGVPSPVVHPDSVNIVIFRENTEDLYAGIEFEAGSPEALQFTQTLKDQFPEAYGKMRFCEDVGIGIKPISHEGTDRLVRAAIEWALANHRSSVTLVHKGNIMKFTEGAFRKWGYDLAEREFGDKVYTWRQWEQTKAELGEQAANAEQKAAEQAGRLVIKDLITDAFFAQTIACAEDYDVVATSNLNGDYISDALAAQVGGLGIAPGANINYQTGVAIFEATHGTAPRYAGQDKVNPSSVILSGEMMLRYMGWNEAADLVIQGIEGAIGAKIMTLDLARETKNATPVKTSEFGKAVVEHMGE